LASSQVVVAARAGVGAGRAGVQAGVEGARAQLERARDAWDRLGAAPLVAEAERWLAGDGG
jgi:thioredoxin reductase